MQRVKRSKGLNVIEGHSGLGHLKNISHPSLFPEEGPSCFAFNFTSEPRVSFPPVIADLMLKIEL